MLHHLSFPGDYKALQINSERRNWQQSHYCSRMGDKAPRAPQGTVCGLSAAIWKWSTHRKMRVLRECVKSLRSVWTNSPRISADLLRDKTNRFLSQLLLSAHDMIHPGSSLFISPPPRRSLPKHRSPSPPPRCPGGWRTSSLKVMTAHFLCHQAEDEAPRWSSVEWSVFTDHAVWGWI